VVVTGGPAPMLVSLRGTGAGVTIVASGAAPDVRVGDCRDFFVKLVNTGNVAWKSGNVRITGPDSLDSELVRSVLQRSPPATAVRS